MKIIHCTDFHFNKSWYEWFAERAPAYDAVCLTGDLLDLDVHLRVQPQEQIKWISNWAAEFPGTLCLCSGNHDLVEGYDYCPWIEKLKRPCVSVDGDVVEISGIRIECVTWYGTPQASPPADIALVHAPPAHTLTGISQAEDRDFGDPELADMATSLPAILLSGHIHWPMRWHDRIGQSLILNPGARHTDPWPAHVEIDLHARTARRRAHEQSDDCISL